MSRPHRLDSGFRPGPDLGSSYLDDLQAGRIGPEGVPLEALRDSSACIVIGRSGGGQPLAIVGDRVPVAKIPADAVPYRVPDLVRLVEGEVGPAAVDVVHQIKSIFGGRVVSVERKGEE